jgi:hypothetical protein
MFRCYLTRSGHIVASEDLDVLTLSEAIIAGYKLLEERPATDALDGIEIWQGRLLLYKSKT